MCPWGCDNISGPLRRLRNNSEDDPSVAGNSLIAAHDYIGLGAFCLGIVLLEIILCDKIVLIHKGKILSSCLTDASISGVGSSSILRGNNSYSFAEGLICIQIFLHIGY